jgi:L,D-peptidoglycan transpeptidase YkuD (ErfK/YbiS/YcfS/YnhG family)
MRISKRLTVILLSLLACSVWLATGWPYSTAEAAEADLIPASVARMLKGKEDVGQAILVMPAGKSTNRVTIRAFQRKDGKWKQVYNMNGYIGKNGFAARKREGDGKSPTGMYTLGHAFGAFANPGTKLPYIRMTAKDVWVDDPKSKLYNTLQQLPAKGRWKSAENMRRKDNLYDYGFVINYNTEKPAAGAGSAIFFHVSSRPTLGCTATSRANVLTLLRWLDPKANPVIIQNPGK